MQRYGFLVKNERYGINYSQTAQKLNYIYIFNMCK